MPFSNTRISEVMVILLVDIFFAPLFYIFNENVPIHWKMYLSSFSHVSRSKNKKKMSVQNQKQCTDNLLLVTSMMKLFFSWYTSIRWEPYKISKISEGNSVNTRMITTFCGGEGRVAKGKSRPDENTSEGYLTSQFYHHHHPCSLRSKPKRRWSQKKKKFTWKPRLPQNVRSNTYSSICGVCVHFLPFLGATFFFYTEYTSETKLRVWSVTKEKSTMFSSRGRGGCDVEWDDKALFCTNKKKHNLK